MEKIKLWGVWLTIIILISSVILINIKNNKLEKQKNDIKIELKEKKDDSIQLEVKNSNVEQQKEEKQANIPKKANIENKGIKMQNKGTYKLTHYGADCSKCSGFTASGFDARHSIYYYDTQFGKVRIVAMYKNMTLYSIIKIKNYKLGGDIIAIVIDRGVGNGVIDLLTNSENEARQLGIQKGVEIEILRRGKGK